MYRVSGALLVPGPQTKRHPEKGGKLNTSQAGSVAASRAAVGQFLSISCEALILRAQYCMIAPDSRKPEICFKCRTSKIPPAATNAAAENCCEKIDYKKREVSSHATVVAASQSLIGSKNRVRRRTSASDSFRAVLSEVGLGKKCWLHLALSH